MAENPTVYIVIPAYNCQDTIEKTIDAIVTQSYHNWRLYVVNDGSTDDTSKILSCFAGISGINIFNQENTGVSAARNAALALIPDDAVIAYCDADDV
ncbi:MAG: glycosyltransferase family A protein, partial [Deltaproteobacteria bacterium]